MARWSLSVFVLPLLVASGCTPKPEPAELVLLGGKIVTLDEVQPEVQALASRGGRIVALGDDGALEAYVGPDTRVVRLGGKLAVPGFIEGHGHFTGIGAALLNLDLRFADSWEAIVEQVEAAAAQAEPGEWIRGRGWHQEKWSTPPEPSVEGNPVHDALSAASPDNPVVLVHASGHAAFVNARAMELSGIDDATPDPSGGTIVRDARGRATGLLRESAEELVAGAWEWSEALGRKQVQLAAEECLAKGVTSFQDAGSPVEEIRLFETLTAEGALPLRLWVMVRDSNEAIRAAMPGLRQVGSGGGFLTVRAIKHSIDGALGSHGAWLLEPYADMPSTTGLNTTPVETIRESAELAVENDLQLCVHAIGDRANRETLDLFGDVLASAPEKERRWRIEHAQHLSLDDIQRFAELGVVASMQGVHCTSDGPWVPQRIGDRRSEEGAYVWQKLLQSGAVVSNGTDAPVEDVDPIANFHSTVTRRMADGSVFYGDQKMTRMEALRSMTWSAAFAAFEEDEKGSLSVGKLADVTVLSQDILSVPDDEIPATQVVYTIVGGRVAYEEK